MREYTKICGIPMIMGIIYTTYLKSPLLTRNVPKINNRHPDEDRFTYTKFDQRELTNTSFRDLSITFDLIIRLCNDTYSSQGICTQSVKWQYSISILYSCLISN